MLNVFIYSYWFSLQRFQVLKLGYLEPYDGMISKLFEKDVERNGRDLIQGTIL